MKPNAYRFWKFIIRRWQHGFMRGWQLLNGSWPRHMRCMLFPRDGRLRLFLRLQYLYWRQQYYMR